MSEENVEIIRQLVEAFNECGMGATEPEEIRLISHRSARRQRLRRP
jgi:hypothetical protein